jgi:hypothetical protein
VHVVSSESVIRGSEENVDLCSHVIYVRGHVIRGSR